MKIGVTGANGYVGKKLCQILSKNHDIVPYYLDVTESIDEFFLIECDAVVHLARKSNRNADQAVLDTNIKGTYNIVSACVEKNKRLVWIGSQGYTKNDAFGVANKIGIEIVKNFQSLNANLSYMLLPHLFGSEFPPFKHSFISTVLWSIANHKEWKHLVQNKDHLYHLMHIESACTKIEEEILNGDSFPFCWTFGATIDTIEKQSSIKGTIFNETIKEYRGKWLT